MDSSRDHSLRDYTIDVCQSCRLLTGLTVGDSTLVGESGKQRIESTWNDAQRVKAATVGVLLSVERETRDNVERVRVFVAGVGGVWQCLIRRQLPY